MSTNRPETMSTFDPYAVARVLETTATDSGKRLVDLTARSPVLLVFLRHAGCTFCREALSDIAEAREKIEATGTVIAVVHMGDRIAMDRLIAKHGLHSVERICDEGQVLYGAFGLRRGSFSQLFGLKVWWRGFLAGVVRGHGLGLPTADAGQMPGVFFVDKGLVARRFRHQSAADRPEYDSLCSRQP